MATPLVAYFAGIGTVTAALGIGFAGAVALLDAQLPAKVPPAVFSAPELKVVEETPKPSSSASIASFEPVNPVASAEAVMNAMAFAAPTAPATALQGPVQKQPKRAIEPVRKAHPKPKPEQKVAAQKPERKPVIVEQREREESTRVSAYAPVRQEAGFFRVLFGN